MMFGIAIDLFFVCCCKLQLLFKSVVITVLVIAESADNCIRTVRSFILGCDFFVYLMTCVLMYYS